MAESSTGGEWPVSATPFLVPVIVIPLALIIDNKAA